MAKDYNQVLLDKGYKIFSDELTQISWIWYNKSSLQSEDLLKKIKQYYYSSLSILDLSNCEPLLEDDGQSITKKR